MEVTYTWDVNTLDTASSENGLTDVVKIVHWCLIATDGVNNVDVYGTVGLDSPADSNFTPFSDLTKEQVVLWVEEKINSNKSKTVKSTDKDEDLIENKPSNVELLKTALADKLKNLSTPSIVTKKAPW